MLSGKNILITGASSGIGAEISKELSKRNANLIITGRNEKRLHEVFLNLHDPEKSSLNICDLTVEDEQVTLVKNLPQLDGIVFCAGVNEYIPVKFITKKKIDKIFNVNYFSVLLLIQKLLKNKLINKGASLVFISSIASQLGVPATTLYAASKSSLNSTVRVLAVELASMKIRANAICPGIVKTPMLDNSNIESSSFIAQEKEYPLGFGDPIDIANAVSFHLSEESRWLTGNIMILDGGFTLQ